MALVEKYAIRTVKPDTTILKTLHYAGLPIAKAVGSETDHNDLHLSELHHGLKKTVALLLAISEEAANERSKITGVNRTASTNTGLVQ
jgi:hypothetical protein